MADGLSALSSETLTAAVTSLLPKPLPDSHFVKSKPTNKKDLTNNGVQERLIIHQRSPKQGNESQCSRTQPLALPIYQDLDEEAGHHVNSSLAVLGTSQESLITNHGAPTGNQQLLQTSQSQGSEIQQSLQTSLCQDQYTTNQSVASGNLRLLQTTQGSVIQQTLQTSQCHPIINHEILQTSQGQHSMLRQALQPIQEKGAESGLNNNLKFSVDSIHLASEGIKGQEVNPQISPTVYGTNNFRTLPDHVINALVASKQPVHNVQLQNVASLLEQRNNTAPVVPSVLQPGVNQSNGLGLLQGVQGMLLQQLLNIQNQGASLTGALWDDRTGSLPVLTSHNAPVPTPSHNAPVPVQSHNAPVPSHNAQVPVQSHNASVPVQSTDVPVHCDTPFSQLSPTQPIQNLIQNLFSQAESLSLPPVNQEGAYTANPVADAGFDSGNDLKGLTVKQKVVSAPLTTKEQDNSYAAYINLLLEAISKNKTLPPQQFHQIQKSIMGSIGSEETLSADPVHSQGQSQAHLLQDQGKNPAIQVQGQNHLLQVQGQNLVLQVHGQTPVMQGQGHIEMVEGEGGELIQKPLPGLPSLQSVPLVLHRRMPDGQVQLIPISRFGQEEQQQTQKKKTAGVASPGNVTTKAPVRIQPKPTYLNIQGLLQPNQVNIASTGPVDMNTVYNLINAQQLIKDTRMPETQDENQSPGLTIQQLYSEGTSQFSEEMPETSPQEVEKTYTAVAMDDVEVDPADGYVTDVHAGQSQDLVENNNAGNMDTADTPMEDSVAVEIDHQQEGEEDNYVFCIDCRKLCKGQCEYHNNVEYKSIPDTPILSMARATLPHIFYLQQSSTTDLKGQQGVWCRESINERTRLGPVVGAQESMKTADYMQEVKGFNPFQLSIQDDMSLVISRTSEDTSNWTMFIRMAHSLLEQNCTLYRQLDQFYFITTMEVKEHEELLFWFCPGLCQHLGLSEDPGVVKMQQCEYCGYNFTAKRLLNTHIKARHPEQSQFTCSFEMCGKQCSNQTQLSRHMLTHMGMKPYACSQCGKRFSDPSNVKTHMNIHTGMKKFQCNICGKLFRQKAHRDMHIVTHTGDKNYKCKYCDKSFARPGDLKTHTYTHTDEFKYKCTYCEKGFYKTQSLKKHLKVHTGERNYMCGKCFKGFQTKYHRDRHLKICKERDGKETSYMSLEEVAKLDATCDAVPLKKVKPDDLTMDQTDDQNRENISHAYYT